MTATVGLFDLRPASEASASRPRRTDVPAARAPSAVGPSPARPSAARPSGARPSGADASRVPATDVPRAAPEEASGSRGERRAATPGPPPSRTVVQLLGASRDELRAAQQADDPGERFASAHLGALRAAAAVLALRARSRRSARPTDAWTLLASVAPEYGEWAAFFSAQSGTRSAIEAGVRGRVSQRDADDMVRQADLFLALVTRTVAGRDR